jgi:hypothetical protein
MMRNVPVFVFGFLLTVGLSASAQAQTATPQTYSLTEDPGFPLMGPQVLTLIRDGSKEVIDQVMPVMPGRDKEYRGHVVYDFAAHKIYTQVLSDPGAPCSVMDYASPAAPAEFDVISGGADLIKELTSDAKEPMKQVGTDTVNGVAATVFEENGSGGKGKLWLAAKGGYPLRIDAISADGKVETVIEVKKLSFAKPPASKFVPPAGCQAVQGVSTATGGHAEVNVGGGSSAQPSANVTKVTLQPIPAYTGACPAHIKMTGTITTDGPGTVWYWFAAGSADPGEALTFTVAGTKTVTHVMTLNPKYGGSMGGGALLEAVMEGPDGSHGPVGIGSNNSDFTIDCAGR